MDSGSLAFLEALYQQYQHNPSSVPQEWQSYFSELVLAEPQVSQAIAAPPSASILPTELAEFVLRVERLVNAYRKRGHLAAQIDPSQ